MAQIIYEDIWTIIFSFLKKNETTIVNGRPVIMRNDYYHPYAFINKTTMDIYFGSPGFLANNDWPKTWRLTAKIMASKYGNYCSNIVQEIAIGLLIESLANIGHGDHMHHYRTLEDAAKKYKKETGNIIELSDRQTTILVKYLHRMKIEHWINALMIEDTIILGDIIDSQEIIDTFPQTRTLNYLMLHCNDFPVVPMGRTSDISPIVAKMLVRRFDWTELENAKRYNRRNKRHKCVSAGYVVAIILFMPIILMALLLCLPTIIASVINRSRMSIAIGFTVNVTIIGSIGIILMILGLTDKI